MKKILFLLFVPLLSFSQTLKFNFETREMKGFLPVRPNQLYTKEAGFGFLPDSPKFFTLDLKEGNYDVKMVLGIENQASETTIKVENRRLMLEKIITPTGEFTTKTFTVNVKTPNFGDYEKIKLKPRELTYQHWDNQLTFEFCGKNPQVKSLEITPNVKACTVFLAGNSTVVDQVQEPFTAWGQMIPRFFESGKIVVNNHAESGESLQSFVAENRLKKILFDMKKGDYLFIEFAHNDQKIKGFRAMFEYKDLLKSYIEQTRSKGGIPVLITSMHRRNFDNKGQIVNTLLDFPDAMREVAQVEKVSLIDLNAMSKILWETLGVEESKKAFVHVAAGTYAGQEKAYADDTHFSNYGAYQLAKCVVEGIRNSDLPLKKYLLKKIPTYSPAQPDNLQTFDFPTSPMVNIIKPDGN